MSTPKVEPTKSIMPSLASVKTFAFTYAWSIFTFIWLLILTIIVGVYLNQLIIKTSIYGSPTATVSSASSSSQGSSSSKPNDLSVSAKVLMSFSIILLVIMGVIALLFLKSPITVEERGYVLIMVHGLLFVSIVSLSVNVLKKVNSVALTAS
jgi:hypothetical protein